MVILLRATTPTIPAVEQAALPNLLELSDRLDSLHATRAALRAKVGARELAKRLNDPMLAAMLRELKRKRDLRDQLENDRAELLQALAETQAKTNQIAGEIGKLDEELESATERLANAERELEREKASRQVESRVPRERSATKRTFSVVVRYNRLYQDRVPGALGLRRTVNTDSFFVHGKEDDYLVISPKPYRGIPLINGDRLPVDVATAFSAVAPESHYVEISIWDDSYSGFQLLREFLVQNGFEYRLILATDGDEIVEGFVLNPMVQ